LQQEAKLWHTLDHPHVLRFLGIHLNTLNDVYLVSPWVDQGPLTAYISNHPQADRTALVRLFSYLILYPAHYIQLRDVIDGLSYLHSNDVVHGDLKGSNTLVTSNIRVVLCDFGLSKMSATLHSATGELLPAPAL
jgi:serine/threonine protein kinase